MKKSFTLVAVAATFLLSSSAVLMAQAPDWSWAKQAGGSG